MHQHLIPYRISCQVDGHQDFLLQQTVRFSRKSHHQLRKSKFPHSSTTLPMYGLLMVWIGVSTGNAYLHLPGSYYRTMKTTKLERKNKRTDMGNMLERVSQLWGIADG